MNDWQAMKRWTPEYLKSVCGDQDIEIMAARESNFLYEIQDKTHRKIVKFSDYVDMVSDLQNESNDYYLTARNGFLDRPSAKPLLEDFAPFSEYLTPDCSPGKAFFWYGPKGTITALHHDHMNLLLSQVQGRKIVKLIPPDEIDLVYNFFSVYSLVDLTDPDFEQFPKFQEATVSEVLLEAGEVLFIPVGWWHYVVATEPTISISFTNFVFPNEFDWYEPRPSLPQEWQNATSTTSV
jgi:ribosomal protein L16 Arg81 hydroxylase